MICKAGRDDLVGKDIAFLNDLAHIDVLDRVMVGSECKVPAHTVELGRFQGRPEGILVADIGQIKNLVKRKIFLC